jgi:hypothetical protein
MMHLLVHFLVLRVMIRYHIMIPLSPLSSSIVVPYQIFANMEYMILAMILPLWLVLGFKILFLLGTTCIHWVSVTRKIKKKSFRNKRVVSSTPPYLHSLKNQTGEWTGEVTGSLVHWSNMWLSWFNSDKKPSNLINN